MTKLMGQTYSGAGMNYLVAAILSVVFLPVTAAALTLELKDGSRVEATKITEAGNRLTVETKYSTFGIAKDEVANLGSLNLGGQTAIPVTSGKEFHSEELADFSVRIDYYDSGNKIGSQLYSNTGKLLLSSGKIPDGTYKEYYPDAKVKKEKELIGGLNNGAFKTYYANGALQSEAYFIEGQINGAYKEFSETGGLIRERTFVNGLLNGYVREYAETGEVKEQKQYINGVPKEPSAIAESTPRESKYGPSAPKIPVYQPAQPYTPAETRAKDKQLSRNSLTFLELEYLPLAGVNKKWEEALQETVDDANSIFYYANGVITSYPGLGITGGIILGNYTNSSAYLAGSYYKGPSAETKISIVDNYARLGYYDEDIDTQFTRVVLGYKDTHPINDNTYFVLNINAGFGSGRVEASGRFSGPAFNPISVKDSETWTGLTWAAGAALAWRYQSSILELGFRYTAFPELKDSENFTDIAWKPVSIYAGFAF